MTDSRLFFCSLKSVPLFTAICTTFYGYRNRAVFRYFQGFFGFLVICRPTRSYYLVLPLRPFNMRFLVFGYLMSYLIIVNMIVIVGKLDNRK